MKYFFMLILIVATTAVAEVSPPIRDPFQPIAQPTSTPSQQLKPLLTRWIPLYFSKADAVAAFISNKSLHFLSAQGQINIDAKNNEIFIEDDASHIAKIRTLIAHLDKPTPQFLIKAKILNLDRNYQKTLGVLFQTENKVSNPLSQFSLDEPDTNENAGLFNLSIAKLPGDELLDMQLSALEEEGHATLISNPSLTTLNNEPAVIESGAEVPYQEATLSGGTSVSFKKAVMRLKVTPQQMPNNTILLHISLNQDKVSALTVKGVPAIQTQQITTQALVKNNQTIVLGGILETEQSNQLQGMPVLDDIPIMGKLFQHNATVRKKSVLLIFITPSMMRENA